MPIKENYPHLTREQLDFYLGQSVTFIKIALKSDNLEEIKNLLRNILDNIEPVKEEH